jgi:hypothetical protein
LATSQQVRTAGDRALEQYSIGPCAVKSEQRENGARRPVENIVLAIGCDDGWSDLVRCAHGIVDERSVIQQRSRTE